jgi:capsular exopolysaccharide synthesis family protein
MREILRLKKVESKNKNRVNKLAQSTVEVAGEDSYPVPGGPGAIPPKDVAVPIKLVVRTDAKFDLNAADPCVKYVLDPLTDVGEQYRLLRAKLSQMQIQRGIKTLLVTGYGEISGLSQILRGEATPEQVMLSSTNLDLCLIASGPVPSDPSELLSSSLMGKTLESLKECFEWVIIDSPPVLGLADAPILAPLCDAVILVVHTDKTPVKLIKESIARIGSDKICGIIMNRGKRRDWNKYHYYRYYQENTQGNHPG